MIKTLHTRRLGLAAIVSTFALAAVAAEPVQLITREEAGLPFVGIASGQVRNLTRGPGIDPLATPTTVNGGPFRLVVKFKPSNGVPIDPATVRLTYRRQPAVDLTQRVKAFVTPEGIEAPAVVVPPGRHIIDIEATDKEGRVGRGQLVVTVDAPK